jgi:putative NIF3 family GTP cyclohydrolase 1 type 2
MSGATVGRIARAVERLAPLETCADFDNSGLIWASGRSVSGVLLAMEADPFTVREAMETGCDMILAHHPLFLDPIKTLRADTPAGSGAPADRASDCALLCAYQF